MNPKTLKLDKGMETALRVALSHLQGQANTLKKSEVEFEREIADSHQRNIDKMLYQLNGGKVSGN